MSKNYAVLLARLDGPYLVDCHIDWIPIEGEESRFDEGHVRAQNLWGGDADKHVCLFSGDDALKVDGLAMNRYYPLAFLNTHQYK